MKEKEEYIANFITCIVEYASHSTAEENKQAESGSLNTVDQTRNTYSQLEKLKKLSRNSILPSLNGNRTSWNLLYDWNAGMMELDLTKSANNLRSGCEDISVEAPSSRRSSLWKYSDRLSENAITPDESVVCVVQNDAPTRANQDGPQNSYSQIIKGGFQVQSSAPDISEKSATERSLSIRHQTKVNGQTSDAKLQTSQDRGHCDLSAAERKEARKASRANKAMTKCLYSQHFLESNSKIDCEKNILKKISSLISAMELRDTSLSSDEILSIICSQLKKSISQPYRSIEKFVMDKAAPEQKVNERSVCSQLPRKGSVPRDYYSMKASDVNYRPERLMLNEMLYDRESSMGGDCDPVDEFKISIESNGTFGFQARRITYTNHEDAMMLPNQVKVVDSSDVQEEHEHPPAVPDAPSQQRSLSYEIMPSETAECQCTKSAEGDLNEAPSVANDCITNPKKSQAAPPLVFTNALFLSRLRLLVAKRRLELERNQYGLKSPATRDTRRKSKRRRSSNSKTDGELSSNLTFPREKSESLNSISSFVTKRNYSLPSRDSVSINSEATKYRKGKKKQKEDLDRDHQLQRETRSKKSGDLQSDEHSLFIQGSRRKTEMNSLSYVQEMGLEFLFPGMSREHKCKASLSDYGLLSTSEHEPVDGAKKRKLDKKNGTKELANKRQRRNSRPRASWVLSKLPSPPPSHRSSMFSNFSLIEEREKVPSFHKVVQNNIECISETMQGPYIHL